MLAPVKPGKRKGARPPIPLRLLPASAPPAPGPRTLLLHKVTSAERRAQDEAEAAERAAGEAARVSFGWWNLKTSNVGRLLHVHESQMYAAHVPGTEQSQNTSSGVFRGHECTCTNQADPFAQVAGV